MSRARNIKPGFFKNEVLVGLPFEFRLLFIGLWTIADREGRFEDRPTRIRMEIFPADNVDVNAGLQSLHDLGFILRYEVDGSRYCQVVAWGKHQSPHFKEQKSTIPAPGKPQALKSHNDVKAPDLPGTSPNVAALIPDSLIPDSPSQKQEPRARVEDGEATPAGLACREIMKAGIMPNPSHPDLLAAIAEGTTVAEFRDAAIECKRKGKGFAYLLAMVRRRKAEAAAPVKPRVEPKPASHAPAVIDRVHLTPAQREANRKRTDMLIATLVSP